jgi:transcriptional regulator with XRE-family HTH domain
MTISDQIKRLRKASSLKLRELSAKTGLSISYLNDLEHGRQNPSLETCSKLAMVYGLSLSKLFDGVDV